MAVTFEDISAEVIAFRDEREWEEFHTPRNLAQAIAIEAGELLEVYLWDRLPLAETWSHACEETADILIYCLTMCHQLGVSPEAIIRSKLEANGSRYPVESSRGSAAKFSDQRNLW